jgi:hypothetical protein
LSRTREQLDRSMEIVEAARERLKGRRRIDFVLPDYYAKYPSGMTKPKLDRSGIIARRE